MKGGGEASGWKPWKGGEEKGQCFFFFLNLSILILQMSAYMACKRDQININLRALTQPQNSFVSEASELQKLPLDGKKQL